MALTRFVVCVAVFLALADTAFAGAQWEMWGPWGTCSTTCGVGVEIRSRMCDSPGGLCQGSTGEQRTCATTNSVCPVDGMWGSWGGFGGCMSSCGPGMMTRSRSCDSPAPVGSGAGCVGSSTDSTSCTNSPCPVDGGWSGWSPWGPCSAECAGGSQLRDRSCTNPAPVGEGMDCDGSGGDLQACNEQRCPGPHPVLNCKKGVVVGPPNHPRLGEDCKCPRHCRVCKRYEQSLPERRKVRCLRCENRRFLVRARRGAQCVVAANCPPGDPPFIPVTENGRRKKVGRECCDARCREREGI